MSGNVPAYIDLTVDMYSVRKVRKRKEKSFTLWLPTVHYINQRTFPV